MAAPSSQVIAAWVKSDLVGTDWIRLDEACSQTLTVRLPNYSTSQIAEIVETNAAYVAEHLREELACCRQDAVPPEFEIDDEASPYIRLSDESSQALARDLCRVDPFRFEELCVDILRALKARAELNRKRSDDGVDFFAIDFDFVPDTVNTPQGCRAAVVGQAKRFKSGHLIKETDLRAFIGGAVKVRNDLLIGRKILPLSPVVFAFWTTSDFDPSAREYARSLGIWYLNGRALARYVRDLGLAGSIKAISDSGPS